MCTINEHLKEDFRLSSNHEAFILQSESSVVFGSALLSVWAGLSGLCHSPENVKRSKILPSDSRILSVKPL